MDLMSETEMAALIKLVWLERLAAFSLEKKTKRALHKQRKMALVEQKNSSLWCDLVTLEWYQLRRLWHKHMQESRWTEASIRFSAQYVFASTQDVRECDFRPIVPLCLFLCLKETSLCLLGSCSYCVCFTNGLHSSCLLFLPLSSPPFCPISYQCIPRGAD